MPMKNHIVIGVYIPPNVVMVKDAAIIGVSSVMANRSGFEVIFAATLPAIRARFFEYT